MTRAAIALGLGRSASAVLDNPGKDRSWFDATTHLTESGFTPGIPMDFPQQK